MVCELLLLSAVWFLFVAFWLETVSVWLFLCHFYHRRWGPSGGGGDDAIERVSADEPGQLLYILGRLDIPARMET